MSRKWMLIIAFTLVVVVILSGWEIYKAFTEEKDVGEYRKYSSKISAFFDVDLLKGLKEADSKVLVKEDDIGSSQVTDQYDTSF